MLTNAAVKAARPRAAGYKLADAGGLHLYVAPNGRRSFRLRFRWQGKEQLLTFGQWPEISLDVARRRADEARAQLARGEDPRDYQNTGSVKVRAFEYVSRHWFEQRRARWSPTHAVDVLASLERDIFPAIGDMPIEAITTPVVLAALRTLEQRGRLETARRVRQRISAVFKHAMSEGWAQQDPAAVVVDALLPPPPARPQPALTELDDVRELIAAVDQLDAPVLVKRAAELLMLTAVRLAAVRGARWSEIEDLDGAAPLWRVPAERMKLKVAEKGEARNDHLVPLSSAAVAVLRAANMHRGDANMHARDDELIFGDVAEGAIGALYKRAGYDGRHVPHGCRASFSTILNECLPSQRAAIDRALGHRGAGDKDDAGVNRKVEGAYNRAAHLGQRRRLFDTWAALLAGASIAADVDEGSAEAA
jgi:integrase